MTNLTDWLTQARDRADAATEGPWELDQFGPDEVEDGPFRFIGSPSDRHIVTPTVHMVAADAEFIAAARTDLPAALDAIQAVLDLHAFDPAVPGVHADGCRHCRIPYPCPTVTALATVLGVSEP